MGLNHSNPIQFGWEKNNLKPIPQAPIMGFSYPNAVPEFYDE